MARAAAEGGTQVMVATPHVRDDYQVEVEDIESGVERINERIAASGLQLVVVAGAEVALPKAASLPDETLRRLCLATGDYILVESPYRSSDIVLEGNVSSL